jgi:hypothetical protein
MAGTGGDEDAADLTVVRAARDVAAFLPATLASLVAQTEACFRLVAVDDGSADATGEILAEHARGQGPRRPVAVIRTGGIGLAAARNLAVAQGGGAYVAFLDGDDLLMPDLLARARRRLADRPGTDLVFALCDHVDAGGRRLGIRSPVPPGDLTPLGALIRPPIHTDSGVVVRREALLAAGGFDASLTGCIGLDMWYRILALRPGNAVCIPEPLVRYRRRPGQITGSAARMERNMTAFLDARAGDAQPLTGVERRRVLAAHRLYWASTAQGEGDAAAARAYTVDAWQTDPAGLARRPYAYGRAAISMVSLLPDGIHGALRRGAQAVLARLR